MKITLVEPYFTGSHKHWAEQLRQNSKHDIEFVTLPGYFWKWRMHGSAISLFEDVRRAPLPDLILATDMLDLSTFRGLMNREGIEIPCVLYFHENQLTYPWSPDDKDPQLGRDMHYGFINYTSALVADACLFNSYYHQDIFLKELRSYLQRLPDHQNVEQVDDIAAKSSVIVPGIANELWNLSPEKKGDTPIILWNHRWEHDKNPSAFFKVLLKLKEDGIEFRLVVLGEGENASEFEQAKELLEDRIDHWGFAESRQDYLHWLAKCDILPVTSNQDFFGISALEAIVAGCYPLLPKRLAFPEHLQDERYYYVSDNEMETRLRSVLEDRTWREGRDQRRSELIKYSWNKISSDYDQFFASLNA